MTKRRRTGAARKVADARFWGIPLDGELPGRERQAGETGDSEAVSLSGGSTASPRAIAIRPTPDPGAVVRSLGPTPLALDQAIAERHLTAVYEEAVRAATALAAANGILAADAGEGD
ncbi:MAG: hypothetical protein ACR2KC_04835 [Acidimicrobiales bacterium]